MGLNELKEDENKNTAKHDVKDSLFRRLFSEPKYTLQLYQALHPEDKTATVSDIDIVTIENVLLNKDYNDLGFLVRDQMIVMIEAQATWSVNIIIRILIYYAETLKRYVNEQDFNIYGTMPIKIPTPEFYVLYNGPDPERIKKDVITLKDDIMVGKGGDIDLRVRVIAHDDSDSIIGQFLTFTKVLYEQVNEFGLTQKAIEATIKICMDKDILREYLSERESEVLSVMSFLFDQQRQVEIYGIDNKRLGDAERLVKAVEHASSKLGCSISEACDIIGCTMEDYQKAKERVDWEKKYQETFGEDKITTVV